MKHLALSGDGQGLAELVGELRRAGYAVTFLPEDGLDGDRHGVRAWGAPDLALLAADDELALVQAADAAGGDLPWLFLCADLPEAEAGDLTTAAYRAGALAVLPAGASTGLVLQAVARSIASLRADRSHSDGPLRRHRQFRPGESITLRTLEVLRIERGVVAQVAWHEDGSEGLVGLWGPGHLLAGHPNDDCGLALRAHTEVEAEIDRLGDDPGDLSGLVERVRRLEAWSSVQSRQSVEQRLLGVLTLLAEQFGVSDGNGTVIDLRITHAQLAAAIGANRVTVTRLLGGLRRRGQLLTVSRDVGERFCLPKVAVATVDARPVVSLQR